MGTRRGRYTEEDLRARLYSFEKKYRRDSEEFLAEWEAGRLPHTGDYFAWAGLCYRLGVGTSARG